MKSLAIIALGLAIIFVAIPAAHADNNTSCTGLLQGVINGNVVVPDGATCLLDSTTVSGNVLVGKGASLSVGVFGSVTISGNLKADQCASVSITPVPGPYAVSIGGNVAIRSCTGMSGFDVGQGSLTIGGNFLCQFNSAPCFAQRGSIGGNANVSRNSGGTSIVAGNQIDGNLLCSGNTAVINASAPNTVAGKRLGQCTGF
jgi:hypothetical protein